jgi:hypothetical protein
VAATTRTCTPTVHVLPFDEWKAWYDRQAEDLKTAKADAAKERQALDAQQSGTTTTNESE